ncbi:hypothetical protein ACO0QE_003604 [Hanseniaspora vineae]
MSSSNRLSLNNLINHEDEDEHKPSIVSEQVKSSAPVDSTNTNSDPKNEALPAQENNGGGVTFGKFDFEYENDDSDEDEDEEQGKKAGEPSHEDDQDEDMDSDDEEFEKDLENELKDGNNDTTQGAEQAIKEEPQESTAVLNGDKAIGIGAKRPHSPNEKATESNINQDKKLRKTQATSSTIIEDFQNKEVSKTTVKEDIAKLSNLANVSKPVKYNITPIWARKWQVKAKGNTNTANNSTSETGNDVSLEDTVNGFPVFLPSFTNVIPDDDLTKSVQEWIYATVVSISEEERPFLELEMKFGKLTGENQVDRINPPISTQSIYTDIDGHLQPNVDSTVFEALTKYFNNQQQQATATGDKKTSFNVIESHTIDSVYRLNDFYNHRRPRFLRLSKDYDTGRIAQFVEKKSIAQLLIYSPKDSYDMKISINLELPLNMNDEPPEKFERETPIHLRNKDRISFIHNNSFTRFDLTHVINKNMNSISKSSLTANDEQAKNITNTYEVELEINTPMLLKAFDHISTDSTKYASLIRSYLNNGTLVRRKMSQLSAEIYEGKKKL